MAVYFELCDNEDDFQQAYAWLVEMYQDNNLPRIPAEKLMRDRYESYRLRRSGEVDNFDEAL